MDNAVPEIALKLLSQALDMQITSKFEQDQRLTRLIVQCMIGTAALLALEYSVTWHGHQWFFVAMAIAVLLLIVANVLAALTLQAKVTLPGSLPSGLWDNLLSDPAVFVPVLVGRLRVAVAANQKAEALRLYRSTIVLNLMLAAVPVTLIALLSLLMLD